MLWVGLPAGGRIPHLERLDIPALFASWSGIQSVSGLGDCLFGFGAAV